MKKLYCHPFIISFFFTLNFVWVSDVYAFKCKYYWCNPKGPNLCSQSALITLYSVLEPWKTQTCTNDGTTIYQGKLTSCNYNCNGTDYDCPC